MVDVPEHRTGSFLRLNVGKYLRLMYYYIFRAILGNFLAQMLVKCSIPWSIRGINEGFGEKIMCKC